MTKLLFIHQNFPAQYYNIAQYYGADPANTVVAIGDASNVRHRPRIQGVNLLGYEAPKPSSRHTHHYLRSHEEHVRRGQAVVRLLSQLRDQGFNPDVILVHPDWGEGLFIRLVYPDTPVLAYAEQWSGFANPALDFDPDFPASADERCLAEYSSATRALSFASADALQTPTRFQFDLLPPAFQERTQILYDGVHSGHFSPDESTVLVLPPPKTAVNAENAALPKWFPLRTEPLTLSRQDTVITFINRVLEPYRGWHVFARALPRIQKAHPEAHIVLMGRTGGSTVSGAGGYGPPPDAQIYKKNRNWRDVMLEELKDSVDWSRLHFTGMLPQKTMRDTLRLSRAHVYLSYPFVLSYSPVEAMLCAAPLVLSDTVPCREIADHEVEALFVDFHSPAQIAEAVIHLLQEPLLALRLGVAARERAMREYDLDVWLPRWIKMIDDLANKKSN